MKNVNEEVKRSGWKTFGVKIWIFLITLITMAMFAFVVTTTIFVKPQLTTNSIATTNNFWDSINWNYWSHNSLTTVGIINIAVVATQFIIVTITSILYKRLGFVIGKKGDFLATIGLTCFATIICFIFGILTKENLFKELPQGVNWSWYNILWETNKTNDVFQPTLVWWALLIFMIVLTIAILILFIVFLVKVLFARSKVKK